jgi:hypothetical protein
VGYEGNAILIVEKGGEAGKTFDLEHDTVILGRGQTKEGSISFDNPFVSRTHAQIHYENGSFRLRDLGSTNGTQLNGKLLEKFKDYPLSDNDNIELAKASVVLRFCHSEITEIMPPPLPPPPPPPHPSVRVDAEARDVWVDGIKLDSALSRLEFDLLLILYRNVGKACSKEDLAKLWGGNIPADEQIEQIIHRLRQRIEPDPSNPSRIITVRGYGYKLILTS